MNHNYATTTLALIAITLLVSGCTFFQKNPAATDNSMKHATVCSQLKQQLLFNSNSPQNPQRMNPTEKAKLAQQYKQYNCDTQDN